MSEPIVDLLDEAWTSISELCGELDEAMWDLPTDLPGWSVKDNLSHIVGTRRTRCGGTTRPTSTCRAWPT